MGCLLSCLGPMERDTGAYMRIVTEDNSDRLLRNMRTTEDIQNNIDMYGLYNLGFRDREGPILRSRNHPNHALGTGIESSMLMQERGLRENIEYNSDMYGVGWRDVENPIIRLGTVSEENQCADNNNYNDM